MTPDLDTLLRDAGREPTIDLDTDAVHARGRRRTALRRAALGVGALALLGVVGVGLASLPAADQRDIGPIDQGPSAPEDSAPRTAEQLPRVTEAALAAELGLTVLRVGVDPLSVPVADVDGPITLAATTPDGEVATGAWAPGDLGAGTFGVTTADGTVWGVDPDGNLAGRNPLTGVERVVPADHPWGPRGTTSDGDLLVSTATRAIEEEGASLRVGVVRADADVVEPYTAAALPDFGAGAFVTALAAAPEALVVATAEVTDDPTVSPTSLHLLRSGAERVLLYHTEVNGRIVLDVEVVGDEVWALEFVDADTVVRRFSLAGEDLGLVDEGSDGAFGPVSHIASSPDGRTVVLSMRAGAAPGGAVVVDVARVRAGASLHDAARVLEVSGIVRLLPAPEATPALARCATGPYAQELDSQVVDAVWFPCAGSGGDDRPVSFFPVERLAGADFASEEARLEAYLGALFEGPTNAEQALGLEPVVSADVASLAGVSVAGAAVTVDIAPGEQVGVLGTTYAGAVFETAVAAAVLQFTGYEHVTLTLAGSCEAWTALREADGCAVLTPAQTPWDR